MTLNSALFLVVLLAVSLASGTGASSAVAPLAVDACVILANPGHYNGKLVKVRGSFRRTSKWSAIERPSCSDEILLVEPADSSVTPPADFKIQEDEAYRKFKNVSDERLPGDPNDAYEAGPRYKYEVVATFVGRLDSGDVRTASGQMFKARLVLKSVSGVVATPR